jgi:hypothetical protein
MIIAQISDTHMLWTLTVEWTNMLKRRLRSAKARAPVHMLAGNKDQQHSLRDFVAGARRRFHALMFACSCPGR